MLAKAARGAYFVAGVAAIFAFAYLCGHGMLEGTLGGNDIPWAVSMVMWLDRWFPDLPIWYPLQGGGTPLLVFYPTGTHLLAVLLHRISGLTQIQAFRLLGFLSIPFTATGIYLLVWVKLRNQTMGFLAGMFYLLSAAAWSWLNHIGIYAQAVSLMYLAPTFLLFDLWISQAISQLPRPTGMAHRLVLPLASVAYCLMFLSHMATALSFSMAVMLYALLLPVIGKRVGGLWTAVRASIARALVGFLGGIGLAAFWFIPFLRAQGLINREGLSEFAAHQTPFTDLGALLGLRQPPANFEIWHVQFTISVAILGAIGLVVAFHRRHVVAAWGVVAIAMAVYTAMPGLWPELVQHFDSVWAYSHIRAISVTMFLLPAVAGYGTVSVAELIYQLPGTLIGRIAGPRAGSQVHIRMASVARAIFVSGGGMALAAGTVLLLRQYPHICGGPYVPGPPSGEAFWPFCFSGQKIQLEDQPQFTLSAEGPDYHREAILSFVSALDIDSSTRMDTSAFLGTLTETLSLYTDASIISIYNYQSSMIHAMWGYLQGVMYSREYGTTREMDQLAKWFGLEYVILNRDYDPVEKYDAAKWPVVFPLIESERAGIEIRGVPDSAGLASLRSENTILVVGGFENGSYDQVFRIALAGALDFEDGLLLEGSHQIDDYTIEELHLHDVLLLHGYGYGDRERAWDLLDQYVREGGSLYVDTGWQYATPDWEMAEAPSVLPISKLTWRDIGRATDYFLEDPAIGRGVETGDFAPLDWEGQSWSISSASGVRAWAHPVLNISGEPIVVAGEYGDGRVVWSGMNLISHAYANNNGEERALVRALLDWLAPARPDAILQDPLLTREHPDHIRFTLTEPVEKGTSLLWREAFSPDWHARVEAGDESTPIPMHRAGPGMTLLQLPQVTQPGAVVRMDYSLGWRGWIGLGLTGLTIVVFAASANSPASLPEFLQRLLGAQFKANPEGLVEWADDPAMKGRASNHRIPHLGEVATDDISRAQSTNHPEAQKADVETTNSGPELPDPLMTRLQELGVDPPPDNSDADQLLGWWRKTRSDKHQGS